MKYILDSDTITLTPPAGLCYDVTDINLDSGGSLIITDVVTSGVYNFPGTIGLPVHFHNEIELAATGGVQIDVIQTNGGQKDVRLFDSDRRKTSAAYPGKWGTGIGSKVRGPF